MTTWAEQGIIVATSNFNNWSLTNGSLDQNTIEDYNGAVTADSFIETTTDGEHRLDYSFTAQASTVYTLQFDLKANGRNKILVNMLDVSGSNNVYYNCDLSLGEAYSSGEIGDATLVLGSITALGNDWYRIKVKASISTTAASIAAIRLTRPWDTPTDITYPGQIIYGLYLNNVSLQQGDATTWTEQ